MQTFVYTVNKTFYPLFLLSAKDEFTEGFLHSFWNYASNLNNTLSDINRKPVITASSVKGILLSDRAI